MTETPVSTPLKPTWFVIIGTVATLIAVVLFLVSGHNASVIRDAEQAKLQTIGHYSSLEQRVARGRITRESIEEMDRSVKPLRTVAWLMLIGGIPLLVIAANKYWISGEAGRKQASENRKQVNEKQLIFVATLVEKHKELLLKKREEGKRVDEYGYADSEKWDIEKKNFVTKVIKREINGNLRLRSETLLDLIERVLDGEEIEAASENTGSSQISEPSHEPPTQQVSFTGPATVSGGIRQFQCSKCKNLIVVSRLDAWTEAICRHCGKKNTVPDLCYNATSYDLENYLHVQPLKL